MTQEEKQLLIKDLCGRLPYGVYVDIYSWQKDSPKLLVECVPGYVNEEVVLKNLAGRHSIKEVKPYLRPMSSMTEEEEKEFNEIIGYKGVNVDGWEICDNVYTMYGIYLPGVSNLIGWLLAHHFDYSGLIEKGLALEAPMDMYKTE